MKEKPKTRDWLCVRSEEERPLVVVGDPNQGHGIVVMCNTKGAKPGRISTAIYAAMKARQKEDTNRGAVPGPNSGSQKIGGSSQCAKGATYIQPGISKAQSQVFDINKDLR